MKIKINYWYLLIGFGIGLLLFFLINGFNSFGNSNYVFKNNDDSYQKCVALDISRYFLENNIPENDIWYRESTNGLCIPGNIRTYDSKTYNLNFYNIKKIFNDKSVLAESVILTNKVTGDTHIFNSKVCTNGYINGLPYHLSAKKGVDNLYTPGHKE